MSNNKQSMKLYTEEEIVSFIKKEFADEIDAETFMENLTPIELPSEEEIEEKLNVERIKQFLYEEICERREYSASRMCEEVLKFIENNEQQ